ncbi:putative 2-succinylbenzoate--CoA ligase [Parvicella tangerina]|uniref:2-succinylbenzoate--CoA ligase n=1 Tax=Parvicella tangerina TaxID=2829795 RepID=A0A916JQS3_9FLAO|nr:putative 2-succinylbenzoate--CoA ligase [Parvicella tangerina]
MKSDLLNEYDLAIKPFLEAYFNPHSCVQVSTSGSTGEPKLIELDKEKMVASAKATLDYFNLKKGDTVLLSLPTKFIAGKMIWVRSIVGELNVLVSKPTSNPIKSLDKKVEFAAMTPHQVGVCLDENPEKFDLIDQLIIGGGAVSESLLVRIQKLTTKCYATYGMTETITHVAVKKLNGTDQSACYEAVGQTTFEVGAQGNLIINAPHLSHKKIETNDIVRLINSRQFEWLGRLDFVINSGGVKLFPEQIESKLENIINNRFFVWKEKDELLGEKAVLVIEGTSTYLPDLSKVLDKIERPKLTYRADEFIYTENGKLDRKASYLKALKT